MDNKTYWRRKAEVDLIDSIDQLNDWLAQGVTKDLAAMIRGRIRTLKNDERCFKVIDHYKKTGKLHEGCRLFCVEPAKVKNKMSELGIEYIPAKSGRKRGEKSIPKRLDRLHYHKWDKSLKIKGEFYERIKEFEV